MVEWRPSAWEQQRAHRSASGPVNVRQLRSSALAKVGRLAVILFLSTIPRGPRAHRMLYPARSPGTSASYLLCQAAPSTSRSVPNIVRKRRVPHRLRLRKAAFLTAAHSRCPAADSSMSRKCTAKLIFHCFLKFRLPKTCHSVAPSDFRIIRPSAQQRRGNSMELILRSVILRFAAHIRAPSAPPTSPSSSARFRGFRTSSTIRAIQLLSRKERSSGPLIVRHH